MNRCRFGFQLLLVLLVAQYDALAWLSGSHQAPVDLYCNWNSHEINCDNLTRLDEIYFDNDSLPLDMDTKQFDKFIIHPLRPIYFDMNILLNYNIEFKSEYELSLINFNGFEMNTSDQFDNHFSRNQVHLTISNSTFELYINKVSIATEKVCTSQSNFFSRFRSLELLDSMLYPRKICREVFAGVNMSHMTISSLSPINSISFLANSAKVNNLNSNIEKLLIKDSQFYLGFDLLDEQVFFKTTEVSIENSKLLQIEDKLFDNFRYPNLRTIKLSLTNFREFFAQSNPDWMLGLNSNVILNPRVMTVYLKDERSEYSYPEGDICLFKNWPHDNLVFPVLMGESSVKKCTCTILWLIQNWSILDLTSDLYATSITAPCFEDNVDFDGLVDKCKFDQKLSNCSRFVNTSPNNISFTTQTEVLSESDTTTATSGLKETQKDDSTLIINLTIGVVILSVALFFTATSFIIYFFRIKIKERIAKMRIKKDEISFATFVTSLNAKDYYFVNRS